MCFLGSSSVATCELTKTSCIQCDLGGKPTGCEETIYNGYSYDDCYNLYDVAHNVSIKYHTDKASCHYRNCFDPDLKYRVNRIVTLTTCSSGNENMTQCVT